VGELITVHEYWGNFAGISKLAKLYPSRRLIVCEPYYESEEENEDAGNFSANSN
jgi:hypothetical protein